MGNDIIDDTSLPKLSGSKTRYYDDDTIQIKIGTKLAEVEKEAMKNIALMAETKAIFSFFNPFNE